MIYDSLDTIPYKLFIKIATTNDFSLLSDTEKDLNVLEQVWSKLYDDHLKYDKSKDNKKVFRLSKEIEALQTQQKVVLIAISCLSFEYNEELVEILRQYGYTLRDENTEQYYDDLKRISREANSIKFKISVLSKQLPKQEDTKAEESEFTVDDVMASYTMIVGYDIDYNTVTYTKFHAIQKQVHLKIKSVEQQNIKPQ